MAVDVSAYAKSLMEAAGITDAEQQKQFEAFFGNDKVKANLTDVLSGVERERGRVAAATEQVKAKDAEMQRYYQEQLRIAAQNKTAVEEAQREVSRYVEMYGQLPDGSNPGNPAAGAAAVQDAIDKKTFDERLAATEQNTIGLTKSVMRIMAKHIKDYPDVELDPDAIAKIAQEQGLSAEKAWEVYTQPAREAKTKAQYEAEKQKAVEAAVLEANSKTGVTQVVDAAPRSEFITNLANQTAPPSALESFVKGWRDPNAAQTMNKEFGPR